MSKPKIAVVKTSPESVLDDFQKLFRLADAGRFLNNKKKTILKDNISWHFPYLSANTTPWQLEGTIQALQGIGCSDLVSVHNNTVVTNAHKGQRLNKLAPLYKKYGVEELFNFDKRDIKWIKYKPKADTPALDKIYPDGFEIPEYFIDKNVIHLPTMKTHIYTTTTGAMKNAFGGLLNKKRHYTHSLIHETLVDLLAIQQELHSGLFAVMDATISGSGPGPRTMQPHDTSLLLAGADQVAIDAVAAKIMGFDPMSIKYIRLAHERGLGIGDVRDIDVVGEDISGMNLHYTVGDNLASMAGDLLWFSPLRIFQRLFFHTPLVYVFVFGSFVYHDFLWWPVVGKRKQRGFAKKSQWGKYFSEY